MDSIFSFIDAHPVVSTLCLILLSVFGISLSHEEE